MQVERIKKFLADPSGDSFEGIALEAFSEAFENDPAARELAERHGQSPNRTRDWRGIPAIPPPSPEVGGGGGKAEAELGRLAAEMAFRRSCLGGLVNPPILSLVGGGFGAATRGVSDLDLTEQWVERFGGPGSLVGTSSGRVDVNAARSWLAGRQRDGRAALVLGSDTTLGRLLSTLERQDLRFRLAFGSRAVVLSEPLSEPMSEPLSEPGNPPSAIPDTERLGLTAEALIRQCRWPGVATACYGQVSNDGAFHLSAPPWLRFSCVEVRGGSEPGPLTALDLTSISHPFRVEIGTAGSLNADGTIATLSGA
jgi:hypothetical protein